MIPGEATFARTFGGAVRVAVAADDAAAAAWLEEFVTPWFAPAAPPADWQVRLSSDAAAQADLLARQPPAGVPRACFALDTSVLALPVADVGGRLHVVDAERSCVLRVTPFTVELFGDPATRRWRFTALLVLLEIAATRMRRHALDLHAAAVAIAGRGLAIVGPKGAGKTTLWVYVLRAGAGAAIANDRVFAAAAADGFAVHGVPTAVKLRAATVAQFPDLAVRLPVVERPYLYGLEELSPRPAEAARPRRADLALSPPQLLRQLGVAPCAAAPLAAIVLPRVRADLEGWAVERIAPRELADLLRANLYGSRQREREATLFEAMDGGRMSPPPGQLEALARRVAGYRVDLGRRAYADASLAARLSEIVGAAA